MMVFSVITLLFAYTTSWTTTAIGASKINYCINWNLLKDTHLHFKTESKAISKIFGL